MPFDEILDKSTQIALVNICGCELPTNLQNFTQQGLTKVKIFQKVFFGGGGYFLKHPVYFSENFCHIFMIRGVAWRGARFNVLYL